MRAAFTHFPPSTIVVGPIPDQGKESDDRLKERTNERTIHALAQGRVFRDMEEKWDDVRIVGCRINNARGVCVCAIHTLTVCPSHYTGTSYSSSAVIIVSYFGRRSLTSVEIIDFLAEVRSSVFAVVSLGHFARHFNFHVRERIEGEAE